MNKKLTILALLAILILAIGLRVFGIGWGLPNSRHYYSYHPDENMVLSAAMNINIFDGQLDPGFYNYGSLYIYVVSFALLLASGWGLVNLGSGDISKYIGDVSNMYMSGRIAALILGVLTVYLVYLLGKRAYGRTVGILAALFMAVMPIHVMHSKFLAVDVPATFFVVLTLIFAMRIAEGHRLRDYLLAGLFAGLAAGTKYNAGLVILAPVAAHIATWINPKCALGFASNSKNPKKTGDGFAIQLLKLISIPVLTFVGFIIGTPGFLLNNEAFMRDFTYEIHHAATGHGLVFVKTGLGWVYHFGHSLLPGMGLPLLVLAVIGVIYALRKRNVADLALLAFLIVYYAMIGAAQIRFARYVIPMLPIMAVLAARVSIDLVDRLKSGRLGSKSLGYAVVCLLVLITAFTATYSVALDTMFVRPDTRDTASDWIRSNIPPGSSIGLATIPWFYTPPLDPQLGILVRAEDRLERAQEFTDYTFVINQNEWDADFLAQESPDYALVTSFEYQDRMRLNDPSVKKYFGVLNRGYTVAQEFSGESALVDQLLIFGQLPHDMSYTSPTITIYSRKRT